MLHYASLELVLLWSFKVPCIFQWQWLYVEKNYTNIQNSKYQATHTHTAYEYYKTLPEGQD